jgi:SAM-dependent methyltransferase
MQDLLCPVCFDHLFLSNSYGICKNDHKYGMSDGILDLMPIITDNTLLDESEHFDKVFEGGNRKFSIEQDPYIGLKLLDKSRKVFEKVITEEWPNLAEKRISIAEIGCGDGSAYWYLGKLAFKAVKYTGIDISLKSLQHVAKVRKNTPPNWDSLFVRTSANLQIFMRESLDIVLSLGALHHLQVEKIIDWVSQSLKPQGLFIIQEPSEGNPFAKVGRNFIRDFNTEGERPLNPREIKNMAIRCGLAPIYERGINFLAGPLAFFPGIAKAPRAIKSVAYLVSVAIDSIVRNQSISYGFIHIYKKEK